MPDAPTLHTIDESPPPPIGMNPHLTICGVHELGPLLKHQDPKHPITHVVSLWDPPTQEEDQTEISQYLDLFTRSLPRAPVLTLYFDDISRPAAGLTEPGIDHMRQVLAFAREALTGHGDDTHLLVHCRMGISRSTACALAILAAANPDAAASDLLSHLLGIRPFIIPNPRLTQFADEILDRDDSLLPAVTTHRAEMMGT